MAMDPVYLIPATAATAVAGWFGRGLLQFLKSRSDEKQHEIDNNTVLEQHRDGLTFDLLTAAREEIQLMREELKKLRPFENHLFHLQQALEHIEAICFAPDEESRSRCERAAKAFLRRMKKLDNAKGVVLDEAQRMQTAEDLGLSPSTLARNEGRDSFNNSDKDS